MKVFIDANVFITVAISFNPVYPSWSQQLLFSKDNIILVTSQSVINEVVDVLKVKGYSAKLQNYFLDNFKYIMTVCNIEVCDNFEVKEYDCVDDKRDYHVFAGALHSNSDIIATYNMKDFSNKNIYNIKVCSPFIVLKELNTHKLSNYIQKYGSISEEGTVFFKGQVLHESSFGCLFTTDTYYVQFNSSGKLQINDKIIEKLQLIPNEEFSFVIRYNKESVDFTLFKKNSKREYFQMMLSLGIPTFELCHINIEGFKRKSPYSFYGHVKMLEFIPSYIKGKSLKAMVENGSYESLIGSI
ncbi:MAG: PIN domain-containing protein [Deferribacterales bacterium]